MSTDSKAAVLLRGAIDRLQRMEDDARINSPRATGALRAATQVLQGALAMENLHLGQALALFDQAKDSIVMLAPRIKPGQRGDAAGLVVPR